MTSLPFYGDAHGEWRPLLKEFAAAIAWGAPPEAVILLGDCDLDRPLRQTIQPIFAARIPVFWIHGNHDVDRDAMWLGLVDSHRQGWLHRRVLRAGVHRIAGLGGVFSGRVWYPRIEGEKPVVRTRLELARRFPRRQRWRREPPIASQAFIVPEDLEVFREMTADILVTHEAPPSHRVGFRVLGELAGYCGGAMHHPRPSP